MSANPDQAQRFFDPASFPWLAPIAHHLDIIKEEAQEVIARYRSLRWLHPDLYTLKGRGVIGHRATFYLEVYGMPLRANQARCPRTTEALADVPGRATAAIYLLDARSRILPHKGATHLLLRAHMGLVCPPGCHLRVESETRSWVEGAFLVFDDTFEHEAWNDTHTMRAILLVDFFRPPLDGPRRDEALAALRAERLGPRDYPWLLAAGLDAEPQTLAPMRAAVPPGKHQETVRELVDQYGLYMS